ncbi:MAG TPA: SGNH/GDSL hydrolase family protein [Clostridia bacterium]
MKSKFKSLFLLVVIILNFIMLFGCNNSANPHNDDPEQDYGTLSIENIKVCINEYKNTTFAVINPVFSFPEKAEELTYTYDTTKLNISNNIVTPLKRKSESINVQASSEHFSTVFQVEVQYFKYSDKDDPYYSLFDTSRFSVENRAEKCKAITSDTTLFIGDSFMDDYFIGEYMAAYSQDKVVLNAGISSTTSYHWEAIYSKVIGQIAPKNIVLHIGTNNFYDAHDLVEETQDSLTRLFMYMHNSYPASKIYWLNITQRQDTAYYSQVNETNSYIEQWCSQYNWITCVDTCSKITADMLRDGVHLKPEKYKVFTDALENAGCEIVKK